MEKDLVSRGIEIGTLFVNIITAIATVAVAMTALKLQERSSSIANAIATKGVEVANRSADLQLRLDSLNQDRKEPNLTMLRAAGTTTEFVYTLQNKGEKDAVILELSFDPSDGTIESSASKNEFVTTSMQRDEVTRHTIDLSTLPLALRYEVGMPIIISPGGVVQVRLKVAPNIPYGVLHAVYNGFRQVELSHSHINRKTVE